jgi:hypothetical protein
MTEKFNFGISNGVCTLVASLEFDSLMEHWLRSDDVDAGFSLPPSLPLDRPLSEWLPWGRRSLFSTDTAADKYSSAGMVTTSLFSFLQSI